MAGRLPLDPPYHEISRNLAATHMQEEPPLFLRKWYLSKEEIEDHSPSRKDGITLREESHLRKLYCSYIKDLGIELKVPQVTIATATMLCHRFYMRQSHAKNHWQTVATACVFLACKAEETPRWLSDLVLVAYKLKYKWDPNAPQRIRQKEIYDKQKEILLLGERLLLTTLAFDLNVELPYKPLVTAVQKLGVGHKDLVKVAWNFVNDWLHTTLCLQYKPHYIAAGSLYLAADLQKVELPRAKGNVWWMQFDVSPKQLKEVIRLMSKLLEQNQKPVSQPVGYRKPESKSVNGKEMLSSPESCISSVSVVAQESRNMALMEAEGASESAVSLCSQKRSSRDANDDVKGIEVCQINDCRGTNGIVKDGVLEPKVGESDRNSGCKIMPSEGSCSKIDVHRIRERFKKRRMDRQAEGNLVVKADDIDSESWMERELESGIEKLSASTQNRNMI